MDNKNPPKKSEIKPGDAVYIIGLDKAIMDFQKQLEFEMAVPNVLLENIWYKIFSSLLTAEWAAYYLALHYGAEPEQVPMVEEFKKTHFPKTLKTYCSKRC